MSDDVLDDEVAAFSVAEMVADGPTHRQRVAFAPVFGQLGTRVAGEARAAAASLGVSADIRLSPARCIVQLGPVALTLAWLGGPRDGIVDGELLCMVWAGQVAPPHEGRPERRPAPRAARPVPLWERSLSPVVQTLDWQWRDGRDADAPAADSVAVAAACLDRLLAAYTERAAAA